MEQIGNVSAALVEQLLSHIEHETRLMRSQLSGQAHLVKDLGFDSVGKLELMAWCERKFNITIDCPTMEKIQTLRDLYIALCAQIIQNRVRNIIARNFRISEQSLSNSDRLTNLGGGLFVEAFINEDLQEAFGCELSEDEFRNATVADIIYRVAAH